MNINHETLELLAREICDSRNGAGHYDAKGTHRSHWRVKAAEMMALAEPIRPPSKKSWWEVLGMTRVTE